MRLLDILLHLRVLSVRRHDWSGGLEDVGVLQLLLQLSLLLPGGAAVPALRADPPRLQRGDPVNPLPGVGVGPLPGPDPHHVVVPGES